MKKKNKIKNKIFRLGFTLVELLVVMTILGILVTLIATGFRSAQARGRDAQRKSDLKQLASSLELLFQDYGKYPDSSNGAVTACPYSASGTSQNCTWGEDQVTDGKTIYFRDIPKDPSTGYSYYYRIVDSPTNQKYQLFARLENSQDKDCLGGDCAVSPVAYSCGTYTCNFAITSPNTSATD